MKIFAVNNYYSKPNVNFKASTDDKKLSSLDLISPIMTVFAQPFEERSNHLRHQINPKDGKLILGRFKLTASDGAELTVTKSATKNYFEPVRYISIAVEKDGVKSVIRINSDSGKVIKPGVDMTFASDDDLFYYNDSELYENGIKNTLDKYIPEITRYTDEGEKLDKTPLIIKSKAKDVDADEIVRKAEKFVKGQDLLFNDVKSIEVSSPKIPMPKKVRSGLPTSVKRMSKIALKKTDGNIKYLDNKDAIFEIYDIAEKYKRLFENKCYSVRYRMILGNFSSIIDRISGSQAIVLKNVEGNNSARILIYPYKSLMRLTIHDEKGNPLRGYLIKDNDKLVENFNYDNYNVIPKRHMFVSEDDYKRFAPHFGKDIENIKNRMLDLDEIIDKISTKV